MKTSIMNLIEANPCGLFDLQPAMSIPQYRENFGFSLKNIFTIYQAKEINHKNEDYFAFPGRTLETLVAVQKESSGDLLVVYIVETIKNGKVYCQLILSDEAYQGMLNDKTTHILQVHQMYSKFWQNHIALNTAN